VPDRNREEVVGELPLVKGVTNPGCEAFVSASASPWWSGFSLFSPTDLPGDRLPEPFLILFPVDCSGRYRRRREIQ